MDQGKQSFQHSPKDPLVQLRGIMLTNPVSHTALRNSFISSFFHIDDILSVVYESISAIIVSITSADSSSLCNLAL